MTGPEHYRRAEELERLAASNYEAGGPGRSRADHYLARAQVHATLALTAATVDQTAARGPGDVGPGWIEAIS